MIIGSKILNYEVISLIGEGGMGDVYLAEHTSIGRKVAIKVLKPELAKNDQIRTRFKNEASVMAHMQHPNIVNLIDYLETEDGLFLVMEYVEGQELSQLLHSLTQPIELNRARNIMIGILDAFAYAHKSGIVHRDVKPSNILIDANDNVKVLDFGIAKLVGDSQFNLTKTGTQIGTVYYMSPEQVKAKELDHRTDIYSLGVTFYELFSGFCPYKGLTSEFEVYSSIVEKELPDLTLSMGNSYKSVWEVIRKATAKDPKDRFQSCEEFKNALNKSVDDKPVPGPDSGSDPRGKSKVGFLFVIVLILALMGAGFIGYKLYFSGNGNASNSNLETNNENIDSDIVENNENTGESTESMDSIGSANQSEIMNWSPSNLKVSQFLNGDPINFASNAEQWKYYVTNGLPVYAYPQFNNEYATFGYLYNHAAVSDYRGLVPNGMSLVSMGDWQYEYDQLGFYGLMNSAGIRLGGHITAKGEPNRFGTRAYYWVSNSNHNGKAGMVKFDSDSEKMTYENYDVKDGMFVRVKF